VEQTASTTFVDDSITVLTTLPKALSGVTGLSVSAVNDPKLAAFMEKPLLISQTNWTSSTAANGNLTSYESTNLLTQQPFANKLMGYRLFRATLCFKVQINAQPFQAGRLLVHFLPFVQNQPGYYLNCRNINLTSKTQHPNFELDCRDTTGTLEVPWVGPAPWLDVVNTTISWGKIYVDVLSPLLTGNSGSTGVEVSLFAYFKNPEFAAPLVPQSGDKRTRRRVRVSTNTETEDVAQGKPISTMLNMASKVTEVAAGVPLLSSIASPATWVLRAMGDLASKFGYSKPNLATNANFVVIRPGHNMGNCEGSSQAEPLALTADPCMSPLPGFGGSDIDEMSWAYIRSVPALVNNFSYSSASSAGTNIYSQTVGPSTLNNSGTNGGGAGVFASYDTFPPFAYVNQAFRFWRGSIHLVLKFVKTDYHSGRLMVVWSPSDNGAGTAATVTTSAYSMRTIIDLREVTEIDIQLPYMIPRCWQAVTGCSGYLQILVLNTLQYPATVGSTIDVLCYYYAGEDYEVAYPSNTGQSSWSTLIPYTPQSGDKVNTKSAGIIGNDNPNVPMVEQYTVGEKFTSLKQLILRYSRMYVNSNSTSTFDGCIAFRMYPWHIGIYNGLSTGIDYFSTGGDMYSFVAAGFALARGGMRFIVNTSGSVTAQLDYSYADFFNMDAGGKSIETSTATLPNSLKLTSGSSSSTFIPYNTTSDNATYQTANPSAFISYSNGPEVLIPHFGMNPSHIIPYNASHSFVVSTTYSETTVPFGALSFDCLNTHSYKKLYRSAGDDHQLGYFIGFPALLNDTA
jgi:hypothetical protein